MSKTEQLDRLVRTGFGNLFGPGSINIFEFGFVTKFSSLFLQINPHFWARKTLINDIFFVAQNKG